MPGQDTADKLKFKQKTKFFKKYMVWQAIDSFGNDSDPYITTGTINASIYLEECLKKRLLPFLVQNHDLDKVLFWPDMATCHYATDAVFW